LKQLAALASLFFLAMAASYMLFLSPWAILYFIVACKTGTWWLRIVITQHI
jgi:hypothetical protein